jgi:hypothetical protein
VTVPDYCTCGTKLAENARFCHRCGRPTSEIVEIEEIAKIAEDAPLPPVLPQTPEAPPAGAQATLQAKLAQMPVSFSNPVALRVGFLMSLAIMFLNMVPGVNFLFPFWWLGAGWCGVPLYRRLTGKALSVPAGARLGSITGVLAFVSMALIFTLTFVFTGKQLTEAMVTQDARMAEVVNNPPMLAFVMLFSLAFAFVAVVGLCTAGGAIGARFTRSKE